MKHIKPYKIFESQEPQQHPDFPTTEEEVHRLCNEYKIENYTINDDLSIDVDGDVDLSYESLYYLPLNFNYVSGYFDCSNNYLETLESSPNTVGGYFSCHHNNLNSLEGSPHTVGGYFNCHRNELTSLKGSPNTLNYVFNCESNALFSLKYLPKGINYTDYYTSFDNNPIYKLVRTFIKNDNTEDLIQEFNDYDILRGNKVVLGRLETFINDFDLEMPNMVEVRKYYKIV